MATISTISQPLRGEFIRTAATAGAVVYRGCPFTGADPVFFAGQLSAVRLCAVMALVSGTWSSLTGLPDEPEKWWGCSARVTGDGIPAPALHPDASEWPEWGTGGKCADGSVIPSAWGSAEKPDYHRSCPPHDGA
ncbi:plasmid partitioning/stability family protein [Pseudomonas aeruginosa]|uniref:plasmid partitioning/stability family protein n=1 Tax=Pseudomonas aeruginosa TaxID=287 RepID=UPI003F5BB3A6